MNECMCVSVRTTSRTYGYEQCTAYSRVVGKSIL